MTRNRERRSFTVAAKSSGHQGFVSIPAKAPRVPQTAARKPLVLGPWATLVDTAPVGTPPTRVDAEPRRVLPNLIAWEAPVPEPEPEVTREPPLPRVKRVSPQGVDGEAPRRRGRPRKHPLPIEPPAVALRKPEPAPVLAAPRVVPSPVRPAPAPVQRKNRPESASLRLGERWKRRLPRSCW